MGLCRRSFWATALSGVIAGCALPGVANALDCDDPAIRPLEGPAGYQARVGDPRCEGFYESPVSGGALEIVSARIGEPPGAKADALHLHVPGAGDRDALRLRAVGLPPRLYYRMSADIVGEQVFSWPLDDVLNAEGIDLADIGMLATMDEGDQTVILPVALNGATGAAILTLRSFLDLDRFVWRVTPEGRRDGDWQELEPARVHAGEVRSFEVDAPGAGLLAVRGRRAGTSEWVALDVLIRLPPR